MTDVHSNPDEEACEGRYPQDFRDYCLVLFERCREVCYMNSFKGRLIYLSDPNKSDTPYAVTRAENHVLLAYRSMSVRVYPEMLKSWEIQKYKDIAEDMMHEVVHVLVEPLWDMVKLNLWVPKDAPDQSFCLGMADKLEHVATNILEDCVVRITWSILGQMPDGWYLPERLLPAASPE